MTKHLQQRLVRIAKRLVFPVSWMAGLSAVLSPATQGSAQAQVVPTTTDGVGTTVTNSDDQYDIAGGTQAGGNLFHEFDEFSLSEDQVANFTSDSGVFNIVGQVSEANPSYIDGTVQVSGSDANLYLVNPSGVLFGPNAQLSLQGSFAATTADQVEFGDQWLTVGEAATDYSTLTADPSAYRFTVEDPSAVVNQGDLAVEAGESIAFVGGNAVSTGSLTAPGGEVGLVAVGGDSTVRLKVPGSLLSLEVAENSVPAGVGDGFAATALPILLTGSPVPIVDSLNVLQNGEVRLQATRIEDREVSVSGEISTRTETGDGGAIALIAHSVDLIDSTLDASGENGGTIRVGGGEGTQGRLHDAGLILLRNDPTLRADGLLGAGGDVYVGASSRANLLSGQISATGTTQGGFVETSADYLNINGVEVDATGDTQGGHWLIDPVEIEIVSGASGANQIDPAAIVSDLDAGMNVSIMTTPGSGSGDIILTDSIVQNGGGSADLTLTGQRIESPNSSDITLTSEGQLTFNLNAVNTRSTLGASAIEDAIALIGDVEGDRVINLNAATYNAGGTITVDTNVAIRGTTTDPADTILRATGSHRIFEVNPNITLDLQNLTLTRRTNTTSGGGILNSGGTLNIDNSHFLDNIATLGGAIRSTSGEITTIDSVVLRSPGELNISNSKFSENHATSLSGGAISAEDSSVNISGGTIFESNTALDDGGAIKLRNAITDIQDTEFSDNHSTDDGGAIAVQDGRVSLNSVNFDDNSAEDGGAFTSWDDATVDFVNAEFTNNTASESGGGLFVVDSTATLTDSEIGDPTDADSGNQSTLGGGGLYTYNSSLTLNNTDVAYNESASSSGGGLIIYDGNATLENGTTVSNNQAAQTGGGIRVQEAIFSLKDSTVENNSANVGGGLYSIGSSINNSTVTVQNTDFILNDASASGGALFAEGESVVELVGNRFTTNEASVGGALSINTQTVTDTGSIFTGNRAVFANSSGGVGGAIYVGPSGGLEVNGSTFTGNSAPSNEDVDNVGNGSGGAIAIYKSQDVSLENITVNLNTAENGAGLLLWGGASVEVVDGTFDDNTAGTDGGAIRSVDANLQIFGTQIINNTAGEDGGALYGSGSTITIEDSETQSVLLSENEARNGGAIYVRDGVDREGTTRIEGAVIEHNDARTGGGIFNRASRLTVIDSSLSDNEAVGIGGGIYSSDSVLTITDSDLTENVAQNGAGLLLAGTNFAEVTRTLFDGNRASSLGGGVHVQDTAEITFKDSVLSGNSASLSGGGLYLADEGATANLTERTILRGNTSTEGGGIYFSGGELNAEAGTRFESNIANTNGGGLYITDEEIDWTGISFVGNQAKLGGGGAIRSQTSTLNLSDFLFLDNTAAGGAGLDIRYGSTATISNTAVTLNRSVANGGGIHVMDASELVLAGVAFNNNEAANGGGVFVNGSELTVTDGSSFTGNAAVTNGGALLATNGSSLSLETARFTNNSAGQSGGGAHVDAANQLDVSGSTFEANRAADGGGVSNLGTTELVNTTFSGNRSTGSGGAISSLGASANLSLRNSTLTQNSAGRLGGGIAEAGGQSTRVLNTIVAGNDSSTARDVSGQFIDDGNNLIGSADGAVGFTRSEWVGSDRTPFDPRLAPLANNGGPTRTHLPLADSFAINAGRTENLPQVDQRGNPRFAGSAVDIGAVELSEQELPAAIVTDSLQTVSTLLDPTLVSSETSDSDGLGLNQSEQSLSSDDASIQQIERSFSQGYEDYWNLAAGPDLTFSDVQAILRRAQEERAVNSAVVYAIFVPPEPIEEETTEVLRIDPTPSADDLLNLSVVLPEGELVSYQLPVTRREASRQVRLLRSSVSDPDDARGHRAFTQQLYQWLLAPIEKELAAQNIHNLMYALDAGLRTAPIAAMRDYDGYSLERYGISVVPSIGLMQAEFPAPVRRTTVAMGVAEFADQPPLPAVPIELDVMKDLVPASQAVLNEQTTVAALASVQSLEQPGLLHLATHASFDNRSPESSLIHLWNEDLSMKDFSQLGWGESDLEMLILSACSTALSGRNSELGFAGLAAAAGVDATVGSLWEVSDVGTLALMSEFYAQLEKTSLRGEALRNAQLALLRGETRIENGNLMTSTGEVDLPDDWGLPTSAALDHPFFWSAFTMVGNPW